MKTCLSILLTCLCLSSSFGQHKRGTFKEILTLCLKELNLEENRLKPHFHNTELIDLIENKMLYLDPDTVFNALMNEDLIAIKIEGYTFEPYSNGTCLKRKESKRIPRKIVRPIVASEKEYVMTLSSPIFSIDGSIACVYLSTSCGPLCGSGELLFLKLEHKDWFFLSRKIITIS